MTHGMDYHCQAPACIAVTAAWVQPPILPCHEFGSTIAFECTDAKAFLLPRRAHTAEPGVYVAAPLGTPSWLCSWSCAATCCSTSSYVMRWCPGRLRAACQSAP